MSVNQAVYVKPPIAGEIAKFAATTSSVVYKTPKSWKGRWVRFYAEATDVYCVFSADGSGLAITATAVGSRAGDGTITNNPFSAPLGASSGTFTDWYPIKDTNDSNAFFYIVCNNATGFWSAHVSDHDSNVPA